MLTNLLDYLRIALYGLLAFIIFALYQNWQQEHPQKTIPTQTVSSVKNDYIPEVSQSTPAANQTVSANPVITTSQHIIHVTTDLLQVDIDALGGNIIQVKLLQYPEALHSKTPYLLLNNQAETRYVAQSGLLATSGPDTSKGQALYNSDKTDYSLAANENEMAVKLQWKNAEGINVDKIFTFKRNNYEIDVAYQITNNSKQIWDGNLYLQLMRKEASDGTSSSFANYALFTGAAISSPDKHFQKISFSDMAEKNLNQSITGGWAAMIQHYFISTWVPEQNTVSQYFTRVTQDGLYTVGMLGPKIQAESGQTIRTQAKFYAGPIVSENLKQVAPHLDLTVDYGWFWFISFIIFWMMQHIYNIIGNWGWAIVLVTIVIKLMFYHLSAKSYRSMSGLKKLQPKMAALKERFGDDRQQFTQATLELYKKEKVNPMSGCLPILIQIPVFIALYWVLIENIELRQAPFILWIQDLSIKDPYYVLPLLMGLSMFLQQRLNPPPADPVQAKVMMLMPVIVTVLFLNFPAGLMLYMFINTALSCLQQWYIMRSMEKADTKAKK